MKKLKQIGNMIKRLSILNILLLTVVAVYFASCESKEEKYKKLVEEMHAEFKGSPFVGLAAHFDKIKSIVEQKGDRNLQKPLTAPIGLRFINLLGRYSDNLYNEEDGIKVLNKNAVKSISGNVMLITDQLFDDSTRVDEWRQNRPFSISYESRLWNLNKRAQDSLAGNKSKFYSADKSTYEKYCTAIIRQAQFDQIDYLFVVRPLVVMKPKIDNTGKVEEGYDFMFTPGFFSANLCLYNYKTKELIWAQNFMAMSSEKLETKQGIHKRMKDNYQQNIGKALDKTILENFNALWR